MSMGPRAVYICKCNIYADFAYDGDLRTVINR